MGKYDDILSGFQDSAPASSSPPQGSGKYADILAAFPPVQTSSTASTENKWIRRASTYGVHPLIEGGAMAAGGAAGGIVAAPAGPIASAIAAPAAAIAMYPPAHAAANAVDRAMGLETQDASLPQALKEGATMEAAGAAIPAVVGAVSKIPFARFAEGMAGSPAQNFSRTFKKGYSVYAAPSVEEASAKFGAEKFKLLGQTLTPEEQAAMVANPNGTATQKLTDVMTDWLKGKEISPKDALMAKQAASTIFPSDTAKQAVKRGSLSQFKDAMDEILTRTAPEMKQANDEFAAAKLKSNMLQPLRVNKTNPDKPSHLGLMLGAGEVGRAITNGHFGEAIAYFAAQSPAFMGFVAATLGQAAKMLPDLSPAEQVNLARGLYSSFQAQQSNRGSPTGEIQ